MSEILYHDRKFEIEQADIEDAVGIGEAHLQSWLETYPNEQYDVTENWIKSEFAFLVEEKGIKYREKIIQNLDGNTLYKVVKDEDGQVQGFLHANKVDDSIKLNAIYLTEKLKGTGVARSLMEDVLDLAAELPINLEVVEYNNRAIKFYEKYGFIRGEVETELFHGKIPVLNMKRSADKQDHKNLNPKLEVRGSSVEGRGLFTKVPIKKDEKLLINIDPQPVEVNEFTDEEFAEFRKKCTENGKEWDSVSIGNGMHRAAISDRDSNPENFGNHSCDPNLSADHVALRDIEAGEELTVDYAPFSDVNWTMKCRCGSRNCKGVVEGLVK